MSKKPLPLIWIFVLVLTFFALICSFVLGNSSLVDFFSQLLAISFPEVILSILHYKSDNYLRSQTYVINVSLGAWYSDRMCHSMQDEVRRRRGSRLRAFPHPFTGALRGPRESRQVHGGVSRQRGEGEKMHDQAFRHRDLQYRPFRGRRSDRSS